MSMADKKDYPKIKRRVWEVQSQCYHNGQPIWTPEIVERVVEQLKSEKLSNGKPALKRWAWCMHDKDKVREENIEQLRLTDPLKEYKIGDDRPAHIHLALEFENAVYNSHLVKITGLGPYYIRKPEAKYMQFMAIATYLSHCKQAEQDKGKHLYPVEEIHCNFEYADEVDAYLAKTRNHIQRSNPRTLADTYINRIESGEIDFESAKREIKDSAAGYAFFLRYEKDLRAARTEYIKRHYEMETRVNYYIYGRSGTGKSTMSKYLARALYPGLEDYECFYTVGATGVRFDDYEYQPIIIWEDVRGENLRDEYGSEGVLNLMELAPKKRTYNIKFGKVTLTHQVNIFTAPYDFEKFVEDMMANDKKGGGQSIEALREQAYRRFPVIIEVRRNEILIYGNDNIFRGHDKSEFSLYYRIDNTNIAQLNSLFGGAALDEAFATITKPMKMLHDKFLEKMSTADKLTAKEYAPRVISVVDFTDGKEDPDIEQYHAFCKNMLEYFRFEENGELGLYRSKPGWMLGDELDGDYEGLLCPMTFEQWAEAGKLSLFDNSIYKDGAYARDITSAKDQINSQRQQRLSLHADEIEAYFNALDAGENPTVPEGVQPEDLEDRSYVFSLLYEEDDYSIDEEKIEKYIVRLKEATEILRKEPDDLHLQEWIQMLLPDDSQSVFLEDAGALECLAECWEKAKAACIEAELAEDDTSWYRLYQVLNSKMNANT